MNNVQHRTCFFGNLNVVKSKTELDQRYEYSPNVLGRFSRLDKYEFVILTEPGRSIIGRATDLLLLDPIVGIFSRVSMESVKVVDTDYLDLAEKGIFLKKCLAVAHAALVVFSVHGFYSVVEQMNFYGLEYVFIEAVAPAVLIYILLIALGFFGIRGFWEDRFLVKVER